MGDKEYKVVIMSGMVILKTVYFSDLEKAFEFVERKEKKGVHIQIFSTESNQRLY